MLRLGVNRCCSDRVLVVPHIAHRRPRYFGPPLFLCDGFWHELTCQRCNRGVILLSCAGLIKKCHPILPGAMSGLGYCIGVLRLNHATFCSSGIGWASFNGSVVVSERVFHHLIPGPCHRGGPGTGG